MPSHFLVLTPPSCKVSKTFANATEKVFQIGHFLTFLLMLTDLNLFANTKNMAFSAWSAPFANGSPIFTFFRPLIGKHVSVTLAKNGPLANPNRGQTPPLVQG